MFEKYGCVKVHGNGYRHATIMQPIIKPVWDYKIDETEIPWLIAEKLSERGFDNLLRHFKQYKDPETGKEPTNAKEFAFYALKLTTHKLWDPAEYQGGDKFSGWEEFSKIGVWNSDPYPFRKRWGKMKTKTGMFEFYSETLKEALGKTCRKAQHHRRTTSWRPVFIQARGEQAFIPHYEEPYTAGDPAEYPFLFVDHKSRLNREGRSANCSWYYEFKDLIRGDEIWDDVAKINPLDGESLESTTAIRFA